MLISLKCYHWAREAWFDKALLAASRPPLAASMFSPLEKCFMLKEAAGTVSQPVHFGYILLGAFWSFEIFWYMLSAFLHFVYLPHARSEFLVLKRYLRWPEQKRATSLAASMFSPIENVWCWRKLQAEFFAARPFRLHPPGCFLVVFFFNNFLFQHFRDKQLDWLNIWLTSRVLKWRWWHAQIEKRHRSLHLGRNSTL